jgi:hypothetical protein
VRLRGSNQADTRQIGEPAAPARRPPDRDDGLDPLLDWDAMVQPEAEYQFDQTIDW